MARRGCRLNSEKRIIASPIYDAGKEMSEEGEKEIRILMVDANEADVDQVFTLLRDAGMRIATERVQSEDGLASALGDFEPDIVLSEYSLPLLDYRTTLKVVQTISPGTPVIVMSGPLRDEDTGSCVRAGAESFISKLNAGMLPAAIRAAVEAREPLSRLTSRQIEVMRLVASGYRTNEVAEVLKLSAKTVESHRHQLMRKLGLVRTTCLIRYAIRVGFMPVMPPTSIIQ
jgi:NarL family two-component system response regulator LiaR